MSQLMEYQVLINNHFLGLAIIEVMLCSMFIFLAFYYFFIERTDLVKYIGLCFIIEILEKVMAMMEVLSTLGYPFDISEDGMEMVRLLISYLLVYSYFILLLYLIRCDSIVLMIIFLCIIPILFFLSFQLSYNYLVYLSYVIVLMIFTVFFSIRLRRWVFLTVSIMVAFYFLLERILIQYVPITDHYEWIIEGILLLLIIAYFMKRYKDIISEKNQLYIKLIHDTLTGAYSKSYFLDELKRCEKGAIIFLDVNYFKCVNDRYGHHVGDDLLRVFSEKVFKSSKYLFCRYGGDEFVLLVSKDAVDEAERIKRLLLLQFKKSLEDLAIKDKEIGISIGIAHFDDYKGGKALLEADDCMYRVKYSGRSPYSNWEGGR